jgi:hypothetical protein
MAPRESIEQRAERAKKALEIYLEPCAVREVAGRMGISYGAAYALIKEAGGPHVFRPRGTRTPRGHTIDE